MTGAKFISDNLVFGDVKFDVDREHKQLYTPRVTHNRHVIYHKKKLLCLPYVIWMASPSEMGGLYPPLAQRQPESAAKLVEGTDAGVSR